MPLLWKARVSKDLLNSEYKASVKMSEFDLITFVGISESWHAFDESRFNISYRRCSELNSLLSFINWRTNLRSLQMYLNINVYKTVKLMVTQKTKIMEYKDTKFKSYTFSTYVFNIVNWNQKTFTFNWLWIQPMRPDAFWRSTIPLKWNQRLHIIYGKS